MDICCEVNYPNRLHCSTGNCDCLTNLLINPLDPRSVEYSRSKEKAMVENRILTSAFPKRFMNILTHFIDQNITL